MIILLLLLNFKLTFDILEMYLQGRFTESRRDDEEPQCLYIY